LGGSAAAGDFLALLSPDREVSVVRDRILPSTRDGDAVLCISHSGETGETRAVWEEAGTRGLPRGAVASGGTLGRLAREAGAPRRESPGELAPRAALGSLLRGAAEVAGLDPEADWSGAARALRERGGEHEPASEVEDLALALNGKLPVLLPSGRGADAAARRWAADLAENSKTPALVWGLPEAAHNLVMVSAGTAPFRDSLVVLCLDAGDAASPEWEALQRVLPTHGVEPRRLDAKGAPPWVGALELAYLGTWTSVRLAEHGNIRAGDLSLMDDLKRILRGGKEASR
jgi:glucose/mannose-6-phosphate isomerase